MAALERSSEHPLAAAIVKGVEARGLRIPSSEAFESVTGLGVKGRVAGRVIVVGNVELLRREGVADAGPSARADDLRQQGQTVMFAVVDGVLVGLMGVADPIKASTSDAVAALRGEGLRLVMLTGDNRHTAQVVSQLGIEEVLADVRPDGKAAAIKALQAQGRIVAMAGDGINDAPLAGRPVRTPTSIPYGCEVHYAAGRALRP